MTRMFFNFDQPETTAQRRLDDALDELDRLRACGQTEVPIALVRRLLGGDRDDLVRFGGRA